MSLPTRLRLRLCVGIGAVKRSSLAMFSLSVQMAFSQVLHEFPQLHGITKSSFRFPTAVSVHAGEHVDPTGIQQPAANPGAVCI